MIITWIIGGLILGGLFASFIDDIIDWAKSILNSLPSTVRKAKVFIKRRGGALIQIIKYKLLGIERVTSSETRTLSLDEIEKMYQDGDIDYNTYIALKNGYEHEIGDIER